MRKTIRFIIKDLFVEKRGTIKVNITRGKRDELIMEIIFIHLQNCIREIFNINLNYIF